MFYSFFNSLANFKYLSIFSIILLRWVLVTTAFADDFLMESKQVSFLKFPGLFSVFWPISTMLQFGWSQLVLLFPSPPVPIPILCRLYRVHQLQLVLPSLSYSFYYFYLTPFRIFHTSVSWWFLTWVLVITSLLMFPGLFSVFYPISTMLWFEQSPPFPLFPSLLVLVLILLRLNQKHQLQLV